jgi:hypothetical protein
VKNTSFVGMLASSRKSFISISTIVKDVYSNKVLIV